MQFEIARGSLMKFTKELNEKTADTKLQGFNNTIRWQIGHILVSGESFLFGFPKSSINLPITYLELFGMGSKPADWTGDIPSLSILIEQLEDQTVRIRELSKASIEETGLSIQFPFGKLETFTDLYGFTLFHEANHLGQIKAMKRFIEN